MKMKEKEIPLKVIVRGLPPYFTEEEFLENVNPLPLHNYFRFVPADTKLGPNANGRCYIKFLEPEELFKFMERYNRYVFVDRKGHESMAFVEYAPFQKIPKASGRKADPKAGTLADDPDFKKYLESLESGIDNEKTSNSIENYLEEIKVREKEAESSKSGPKVITPLIEYVRQKREERRVFAEAKKEDRRRYEERRRAIEEEKRRVKEAREQERREQKMNRNAASAAKAKAAREEDPADVGEEVSVRVCENPERRKSAKAMGGGKGERSHGGNAGSAGGSRPRSGSYRGGGGGGGGNAVDDASGGGGGGGGGGHFSGHSQRRHRPESYFESRSRNKNARAQNSGGGAGDAKAGKGSENAGEQPTGGGAPSRRERAHSGAEKGLTPEEKDGKDGQGRPKPRRADRPIYNPAERIAERQRQKKQQQAKEQAKKTSQWSLSIIVNFVVNKLKRERKETDIFLKVLFKFPICMAKRTRRGGFS